MKMLLNLSRSVSGQKSLRKFFYLVTAVSIFTSTACEEEPQIVLAGDTPVQEYFDRFIYEASVRGLDVEYATSQVEARIGDIVEPNVIGQCRWSSNHSHSITLDRQYWTHANDLQREFLVFHELGHCVLGRDHRDESDANGNCVSIMSSGTGTCRVFYLQHNRRGLVDELFSD